MAGVTRGRTTDAGSNQDATARTRPHAPARDREAATGPKGLWLPVALVLILSIAAFLATRNAAFVWDDHIIVEANREITSLARLPAAFGSHAFAGADDVMAGEHAVQYYRPVWILLLGIEFALSGLNPIGYHWTGILLHALASVAVLLLSRALLRDSRAALIAALVFALHPVHVEAVAWISASNELLAGLFGTLFVLAYLRLRRVGGVMNGVACILALIVALLSKESAVVLPLLAVACEVLPGEGRLLPRLRWPIAFGIIAVVYLAVRSHTVQPHPDPHPLAWRLLTAPRLLVDYLGLLVFPFRLRVFHLIPFVKSASDPALLLPAATLLGSLAALMWARRRSPVLCFGLAWTAVALLPASGILAEPQPALLAERYLYLPSVGFALAVGALCELGAAGASVARQRVFMGAALLALATFMFASVRQGAVWHDDYSLMSRMVIDAPTAATGHANLGVVLERRGRLEEATREYRAAATLEPGDHMMHRNLGIALAKRNLNQEAEKEIRTALALKPDYAQARGDLGWLLAREARWTEARREYALALDAQPANAENRIGLGEALMNLGLLNEAEREIRSVIARHPENARAHVVLSAITERAGRYDESEHEASIARRLSPGAGDSHYNMGVALSRQGQTDAAAREFESALALQPRWAKARFNLGVMRARQRRRAEALAEFDRAIEFAPPDTALAGRARAARRIVAATP